MAQKVNPISLRLRKTNRNFDCGWFNNSNYVNLLMKNFKIKKYIDSILKKVKFSSARFYIQNLHNKMKINVFFCNYNESRNHMSQVFYLNNYKKTRKLKKNLLSKKHNKISKKHCKIVCYLQSSQKNDLYNVVHSYNNVFLPLLENSMFAYKNIFSEKKKENLSKYKNTFATIVNKNNLTNYKNYCNSINTFNQIYIRYFLIKYFSCNNSSIHNTVYYCNALLINNKLQKQTKYTNYTKQVFTKKNETKNLQIVTCNNVSLNFNNVFFPLKENTYLSLITRTRFLMQQTQFLFYTGFFTFFKLQKKQSFIAFQYNKLHNLFIKQLFLYKKNTFTSKTKVDNFKADSDVQQTLLKKLSNTCIKNVETSNHKHLYDFTILQEKILYDKYTTTLNNTIKSKLSKLCNKLYDKYKFTSEHSCLLFFNKVNIKHSTSLSIHDVYKNPLTVLYSKKAVMKKHSNYRNLSFINNQYLNKTYTNYCNLRKTNIFHKQFFYNNLQVEKINKNCFAAFSLHTSEKRKINNLEKFLIANPPYKHHIESTIYSNTYKPVNLQFFKTTNIFMNASYLIDEIIYYMEKKVPFFKLKNAVLKKLTMQKFLRIKGIRVMCSGRVGGKSKKAQKAKIQNFKYGETSLHVFSSKIDFKAKSAFTNFGTLGIKVWICYQ